MTSVRRVIYCPKCNGENIETKCLNPRVERISMDDLGGPRVVNAVWNPSMFKVTCQDCGYTKEYVQ